MAAPVDGDWLLLVELAADHDQTVRLAELLDVAELCGEPAVGVDVAAQQRLWRVRESLADVLGVYGPPLKFDVSLPLSAIGGFARDAVALIDAAGSPTRCRCYSATSARATCTSTSCVFRSNGRLRCTRR